MSSAAFSLFGIGQLIALLASGTCARLGGTKMANPGLSSDVVSWVNPYDNLFVIGGVPNYQGQDAASFRLGNTPGNPGIVDTLPNYWWRSLFIPAGQTLTSENPGGAADTLIQLGEKTNKSRTFAFHITNFANQNKVLKAWNAIATPDSSAKGDAMISLEGQWTNILGTIQCIQMVTLSKNMGAGAQFSVWGINSPTPY